MIIEIMLFVSVFANVILLFLLIGYHTFMKKLWLEIDEHRDFKQRNRDRK